MLGGIVGCWGEILSEGETGSSGNWLGTIRNMLSIQHRDFCGRTRWAKNRGRSVVGGSDPPPTC
jgi:hypothetical protein